MGGGANPRPFLDHDQWVKLRKLGKARINEPGLNPRTKRQRQELYWFMLIWVGAALRVGEAYSLRWRDCELIKLSDKDHTEAMHMKVLGKHSRGGTARGSLRHVRRRHRLQGDESRAEAGTSLNLGLRRMAAISAP